MKYCKNCNKETDRYKSGHCKECVKNRNKLLIKSRKGLSVNDLLYKQVNETRQTFYKESYSKFSLVDVIKSHKQNKGNFVYFLINNNELVYIGKSNGNLLQRIGSHIKTKTFEEVYYKSFMSERIACIQEKQLITKYRPKLNKEWIFNDAKYKIFDLKTEEVIEDTKDNLVSILNTSKRGLDRLLHEYTVKLYHRYVLNKNRPMESSFKNVLDTHTGEIERHNHLTFAEKIGKKPNDVWYFINGVNKTIMKKRYVLVDNHKENL